MYLLVHFLTIQSEPPKLFTVKNQEKTKESLLAKTAGTKALFLWRTYAEKTTAIVRLKEAFCFLKCECDAGLVPCQKVIYSKP